MTQLLPPRPTMTRGRWQALFAAIAAVVTFLLIQTDVALEPIVKVALGAINVALATIRPGGEGASEPSYPLPPPQ